MAHQGADAGEWFERWFGEDYKALYPHRDEAQAAAQVAALLDAISLESRAGEPARILDIACGGGRHLRAFGARGLNPVGVDLSLVLLRDASASGLDVARADMRRLPFRDGAFDLAGCFFTSFGYFEAFEQDVAALTEFRRVVRSGGFLFLDLPNAAYVANTLVPQEDVVVNGHQVAVRRSLEDDFVVKRIRIAPHGDEPPAEHMERVRLFTLARLQPVFDALALRLERVFGDENGADYDPERSPRMSLLLRCEA
jgi:SAM-dependent methyltransferase